jgi:hypothetical protein
MYNGHKNDYNRTFSRVTEKKSARNARIPWNMIVLSFVFIFNPNISIVDPLPDFIGYIILSASLVKLSMLCEPLADARRAFERMILIDVAKLFALVWVFGIDVASERSSSLLLWSFVFGLFEVLFLAPAFVKLFDGFGELGNFHVNSAIHGAKYKEGKSYTEKIKVFSVFFVVFKAAMTLLPELSALGNVSYVEVSNTISLYRYIGVMRGFCVIPVLVVGIAWLVSAFRYFARIKTDKTFCDSVTRAYCEKVIPKEGIFVIRNVKIATWLFVAAMAFTIDIKLDGSNILPDILMLVLLVPSFVYLCRTTKFKRSATVVTMVMYGLTSIATIITNAYYQDNYTYNAMARSSEAFFAYLIYVVSVALHGIVFICLLTSWSKNNRKVIEAHTGYVRGKETQSETENLKIAEFHKELSKSYMLMLDVALIYVLSDIAYALYGAFYAFMNKNFDWLGLVNLACGIFFVAMALRTMSELREAVQTKYILE